MQDYIHPTNPTINKKNKKNKTERESKKLISKCAILMLTRLEIIFH